MSIETVFHKQIPNASGDDSAGVNVDSMTFVLFGGTGDLAKRKIFPALFNLYLTNKLPSSFLVIGITLMNLGSLKLLPMIHLLLLVYVSTIRHGKVSLFLYEQVREWLKKQQRLLSNSKIL